MTAAASDANADGRNIFQIFISETGAIPERILACMDAMQEATPGYRYHRFDEPALRAFLGEHYPPRVLAALDTLRPYSYKSDLGRFCLLHHFGGWYIDATVALHSELPDARAYDHVLFEDAPRIDMKPGEAAVGLLYARAGSPLLAKAIELIVDNCERRDFGDGPLDPTGPGLFGRARRLLGSDGVALAGRYFPLTPDHPRKNYAFVLPDGTVLAWGKVTHGTRAADGLGVFKAPGTNSYNVLWERGLCYVDPNPWRRWSRAVPHAVLTLVRRVASKLRSLWSSWRAGAA